MRKNPGRKERRADINQARGLRKRKHTRKSNTTPTLGVTGTQRKMMGLTKRDA